MAEECDRTNLSHAKLVLDPSVSNRNQTARVCHRLTLFVLIVVLFVINYSTAWATSGTEGASFLDIPVGAAPAAMGSAYTARATDGYAPVWNPAGLGFADRVSLSATQLFYLQGISYEYLGVAIPAGGTFDGDGFSLGNHRGFGASVQYLGSGNIPGYTVDGAGNPVQTGDFSTTFAAYSLAFGQELTPDWSVGVTGKAITESIADTSARAYAGDIGTMYQVSNKVALAATATNLGSSIKFVSTADPLPQAYRAGALVQIDRETDVSADVTYRRTGLLSANAGVQWEVFKVLCLRGGLDTSHSKGSSAVSLITAGLGLRLFGQEFSYAWVPYGDLGNAQYISLDIHFGKSGETKKHGILKAEDEDMPARDSEAVRDFKALFSDDN